jgi:hypothetical protein
MDSEEPELNPPLVKTDSAKTSELLIKLSIRPSFRENSEQIWERGSRLLQGALNPTLA